MNSKTEKSEKHNKNAQEAASELMDINDAYESIHDRLFSISKNIVDAEDVSTQNRRDIFLLMADCIEISMKLANLLKAGGFQNGSK